MTSLVRYVKHGILTFLAAKETSQKSIMNVTQPTLAQLHILDILWFTNLM